MSFEEMEKIEIERVVGALFVKKFGAPLMKRRSQL